MIDTDILAKISHLIVPFIAIVLFKSLNSTIKLKLAAIALLLFSTLRTVKIQSSRGLYK